LIDSFIRHSLIDSLILYNIIMESSNNNNDNAVPNNTLVESGGGDDEHKQAATTTATMPNTTNVDPLADGDTATNATTTTTAAATTTLASTSTTLSNFQDTVSRTTVVSSSNRGSSSNSSSNNSSNNSSSNNSNELLALLAADVLSNEIILEQQAEIEKLRSKLQSLTNKCETVEVTGRNGWPVYATGHLKRDGEKLLSNEQYWDVSLQPTETCCSSMERLAQVEIRVGGAMQNPIQHTVESGKLAATNQRDDWYDHDSQSGFVYIPFHLCHLWVNVGPISRIKYTSLPRKFGTYALTGVLSRLFDHQDDGAVSFASVRFLTAFLTNCD
jgi:hypothetical protein